MLVFSIINLCLISAFIGFGLGVKIGIKTGNDKKRLEVKLKILKEIKESEMDPVDLRALLKIKSLLDL